MRLYNMNKLKILIDSSGDLNPIIREKYDIDIIPLHVNLGEKSYRDGIEIKPSDVFDYYAETGELATTSAIVPDVYTEFFKKWTNEGYSIMYFGISPKFTSSFRNAEIASEAFDNVFIIDSESLSTGSGLLALWAARLNQEGKSILEILTEIEKIRSEINGSFVLDTLKYMYKGGRCSGVKAFGTNILSIKPCLEIKNGTLNVGKKYRGKIDKVLLDYIEHELKNKTNIDTKTAFITHTGVDPELVETLKNKMLSYQPFEEIIESIAGATVSVHCGPNTLGIFYRELS